MHTAREKNLQGNRITLDRPQDADLEAGARRG